MKLLQKRLLAIGNLIKNKKQIKGQFSNLKLKRNNNKKSNMKLIGGAGDAIGSLR